MENYLLDLDSIFNKIKKEMPVLGEAEYFKSLSDYQNQLKALSVDISA